MKAYFTLHINRVALRLVLFSFLGGSLVILISLAANFNYLFIAGAVFFALSVFFNALMLMTQTFNLIFNYKKFEENLSALVLVLINISVAGLYLNFILKIL